MLASFACTLITRSKKRGDHRGLSFYTGSTKVVNLVITIALKSRQECLITSCFILKVLSSEVYVRFCFPLFLCHIWVELANQAAYPACLALPSCQFVFKFASIKLCFLVALWPSRVFRGLCLCPAPLPCSWPQWQQTCARPRPVLK